MWLAAVLASALVRSTVLLTDAVPAVRGYGGSDGGGCGEGGGGGKTSAMVGGVTIASTAIGMPVTLARMAVALLGLLVAMAIADCTEAAAAVLVWMLTRTTTLPAHIVNSTADGPTPARPAIALFISARTLGVNEETSPASSRVKPTMLVAGGKGGGGEGEGGGGEGGDGRGEGGGGVDAPPPKVEGGGGDAPPPKVGGGRGGGEGGGGEGEGGGGVGSGEGCVGSGEGGGGA